MLKIKKICLFKIFLILFINSRKFDLNFSNNSQKAIIPIHSKFNESWRTYLYNKKLCQIGVLLEELEILASKIFIFYFFIKNFAFFNSLYQLQTQLYIKYRIN